MPFEKGNKLGRKATKSRMENKQRLFEFLASGGARMYQEKLDKLANGEGITKEEEQFMDRSERLYEYVFPKLARTEMTGKDGGAVEVDNNITISFK